MGDDPFILEGVPEAYFPHTESNPFCSDEDCDCHEDPELIAEVNNDYQEGLLSAEDATRINISMQLEVLLSPVATITLVTKAQQVAASGSISGRLLGPVTLSQASDARATGKKHQNAQQATGTLTFYNGLATPQYESAGTVLTGQDGDRVALDQSITIPANNPPSDGVAYGTAHALQPGARGNIPAEDMNLTLSAGVYVKNLMPFVGGQDARDLTIVQQKDIDTATQSLTEQVQASMHAALQGQVHPGEQLVPMRCKPSVAADHAGEDEATLVHVTVSENCSAVAYSNQELTKQATQAVTTQMVKHVGQGYRLSGTVQSTITNIQITQQAVVLSFIAHARCVYPITVERVIHLISSKPRLVALQLLAHLPGVSHVGMRGITDNQPLPTDGSHLHLLIIEED